MISRTWHGAVPLEHKESFARYLDLTGVEDAQKLVGNCGIYVHEVDQDDYAHFFLCTLWETLDDVVAYAGQNYRVAITYPEDALYGLISDPIVVCQEVTRAENPFL